MKKILILSLFILLIGCVIPSTPKSFNGSVKINKTNGIVTTITIEMPDTITVDNRVDTDALVNEIEALVLDLRHAQEQMPIVEPK